MTLAVRIASALKPLVDLAYPPRCPVCGDALGTQDGLCLKCWETLEQPGTPSCAACQRPLPHSMEGSLEARCAPCLADPPRHSGIAAATIYTDVSRKLVLSFKHGGRIALARLMGRLIAARLGPLDSTTLLIPVPLHRWRMWRRGYNQSGLLAKEIGRITGAPVRLDALERTRATPSLGGLGKKARKRALQGSIKANPANGNLLRGANIVLVDDVMTSGATADACISALLKAGAGKVRIACFARVIDGTDYPNSRRGADVENETPGAPVGTPGAA